MEVAITFGQLSPAIAGALIAKAIEVGATSHNAVEAAGLSHTAALKADEEAPAPKRRGRQKKAKVEEVEVEETAEEDLDFGDEDSDDENGDVVDDEELESEEDDEIEELPAPKKKRAAASAAKGLTLKDDVMPAFRAYVERKGGKGRDFVKKILDKYKVKSVQDIPAEHFAAVIKQLAA